MKRAALSIVFVLLASPCLYAQEPVKHLYLGNDTHTDLMWNGDEEAWYQYSLDMAKFYLELGESTSGSAPEARSKWNYDVSWTLYMMEKRAPKELFERIIAQLKKGQASVPYNFVLPVYGASTLESVLRSFYYGGYLERTYGIPVELAVCQENATIPLGLSSLWAGSGAKYSWRGVCNCATKVNTIGDRDQEIYWYTGLDGSRILMKWYSNYGWNADLGGYAEMLEPTVAVQNMAAMSGSDRYPYLIAGAFGKGWDNIHNYSYDLVWGLGHRTLPGTKLYLSNQVDFFKHFEAEYGEGLPAISLSYGNEWDLNLASLAEVNGRLKRSMEKLRSAEALAAIASIEDPRFLKSLKQQKEDFLYGIGVFNLHGWTADGPISRHDFASWVRTQQEKVTRYVDSLYDVSVQKIGSFINPASEGEIYFVFQPLNWERSGYVDIPAREGLNSIRDVGSGKMLESALLNEGQSQFLRVWVEDIPSTGYRLIQRTESERKEGQKFSFTGDTLETPFYTAKFKRSGSITSLYDKKNRKEWASGLLNHLGGDPDVGEEAQISAMGDSFVTLRFRSSQPVRHECEVTFFAHTPRIDIENTIQQNFSELLHWSFEFNVEDPEVWHEEVGAVIKAKRASEGGHYADRMARYDYLTLNHFVNVGNSSENITLSNSSSLFFRLGNSTPEFLDSKSSNIHVLVGGQVNENLGVPGQDGDALFHQSFALLPQDRPFDAGASMRFALEHQNPPVTGPVSSGGSWSDSVHSFFKNRDRNVVLWAFKPGEEQGATVRLWNLNPAPVVARITFDHPIGKATYTTHVETDISPVSFEKETVSTGLKQLELRTLHLLFE